MNGARWASIGALGEIQASIVFVAVVTAAALGALAAEDAHLGVACGCVGLAALLALAAGVGLRVTLIAVALAGHLVSGPLFIEGVVSDSFSAFLDVLIVASFVLLAVEPIAKPRPWRTAVLAFAAFIVLQAFNPTLPSIGYGLAGARPFVIPLLLLVAVGCGRLRPPEERLLVSVLLIGWIVNLILAGRQLLGGFTTDELQWIHLSHSSYAVGEQIRLIGASRSNQDFAFLVAVALPALCACSLAGRVGEGWRVGSWLLTAATLGVLVGSLVRSALVGGVIGSLGVVATIAGRRTSVRRVIIPTAALALAVWLAATYGASLFLSEQHAHTITTRVASVFAPQRDYAVQQRRSRVWPRALHEIDRHPLGAGAGSAGPLSQARGDAPLGPLVPDNGYLLVALQFGIPGLALFAVMLALIAVELWRRSRAGALMAVAAFGGVVALSVLMLTGNFISLVSPSCAWAVLVGLGLRAGTTRAINEDIAPEGS